MSDVHLPWPINVGRANPEPGDMATCLVCDREVYLTKPAAFVTKRGHETIRPEHWRHVPKPHVKVRKAPTLRQLRAALVALAQGWNTRAEFYDESQANHGAAPATLQQCADDVMEAIGLDWSDVEKMEVPLA